MSWLFQVYCEEIFTQSGGAATKKPEYLAQRRKGRKGKNESELGVLGVLARE
jgi:hypothetical protein